MKSLLLMSALLINPIHYANEVEQTPVVENLEEETQEKTLEEQVKDLINQNEWLKSIVETCGLVFGVLGGGSFVSLLAVVVRAIYTSIKSKKIQKETLSSVKDAILNEVKSTIGDEVAQKIEKPITDLTNTLARVEDLQSVLGKIIALSQEDSYKARLAILECIASLNIVDKQIIDNAKQEIEQEQKEEQEQLDNANENLDKVIEETEPQQEEEEVYAKI